MMDDISAMREYWVEAEPPSHGAQDRALTALQAEIAQSGAAAAPVRARNGSDARTRFLPTWVWRTGVATVAAAALAAGLVVTVGPNRDPGNEASGPQSPSPVVGPAGEAIELAAAYAAAQPFTQPRPNQWAYVELKIVIPDPSHNGKTSEALRKSWYRIDGSQIAIPDSNGKIKITTHPEDEGRVGPKPALNPHDYPALAAMPTDPQALLTFLRAGLEPAADPNLDRSGSLFGLIGYILRENVLPPQQTAALLRAAAQIPGVSEVPGAVTVDGRQAIAVGRVDGWSREDILLDKDTKEFLGSRSVAVEDQPASEALVRQPTDQPSREIGGAAAKKGDILFIITRGNCTIVDTPGQVH
jgi:hypothetical protein